MGNISNGTFDARSSEDSHLMRHCHHLETAARDTPSKLGTKVADYSPHHDYQGVASEIFLFQFACLSAHMNDRSTRAKPLQPVSTILAIFLD